MIKSMDDLISKAKKIETKTMVVACAADQHVLEAVELARESNIINGILVGDEKEIKSLLNSLNINSENYQFIDESDKTEACLKSVKLVIVATS